jgi:hypothetical protein
VRTIATFEVLRPRSRGTGQFERLSWEAGAQQEGFRENQSTSTMRLRLSSSNTRWAKGGREGIAVDDAVVEFEA